MWKLADMAPPRIVILPSERLGHRDPGLYAGALELTLAYELAQTGSQLQLEWVEFPTLSKHPITNFSLSTPFDFRLRVGYQGLSLPPFFEGYLLRIIPAHRKISYCTRTQDRL